MKRTLFKALLKYLKRDRVSVIIIVLLSLVAVAFGAALPYFIGIATEETISELNNVNFSKLYEVLLICFLLGLGSPLISWIISIIASKVTYRLATEFRLDVFKKIHALELKDIDTKQIGELQSLMINDIELIVDGFAHLFTMSFFSVLTLIASLIMMFILHYLLAIIVLFIAIIAIVITQYTSHQSFKAVMKAQKETADYYAFSNEMISEIKIVNSFNYEKIASQQNEIINEKLRNSRQKAMFFSSLTNPVSRVFNHLIFIAVGLIAGLSYINKEPITIGVITSLLLYATQFGKPLTELSNIATEIQNSLVACKRITDFLELTVENKKKEKLELYYVKGNIEFKHLYFSYHPNQSLIEDFNLSVKSGQVIAIVGPTGAGKSTLVNLLMQFYNLNAGQILLDGHDIANYSAESVRKYFGMVLQNTWLKQASIKENLLYGCNAAYEQKMYEVAKKCQIHELIMGLPEGYDTIITEHSTLISQGEKQLITIARAMLANPKVLILDEATSAIDTHTELLIQEALDNIMKGKTSFIIAHRLSTIVNADQIIVLNNGKVIEVGNHSQLLANKNFYYQLYNSQFDKTID